MNPLDFIDPVLVSLTALKGPKLLIAFLVVVGYGLKFVPGFSNRYIPYVTMPLGALLAPFLVAWPKPENMEPDLRYNEVAAWIQVEIMGVLLASVAWAMHAKILKRVIDNKFETPSFTPPEGSDKPTP